MALYSMLNHFVCLCVCVCVYVCEDCDCEENSLLGSEIVFSVEIYCCVERTFRFHLRGTESYISVFLLGLLFS